MTTLLAVDLRGRCVVVVGGGPVAASHVELLTEQGAQVRVVAPALCEQLAARCVGGAVEWRGHDAREEDLEGAWLVHAATGDPATDRRVAEWAQGCATWCVTSDESPAGSARLPASARAGDVLVGILAAAGAPPERAADVMGGVRERLVAGVDLRRRRRHPGAGPGRVVLVGGGPGPVDLITLRGRRALAEADVVVADRLGPTSVLGDLPPDVEVVDVGKRPGHHPVPQAAINDLLVQHARDGRTVVRLKGGDPFVYGRGGEEVLACRAAGVPVEVVPGLSSALAVPALAGIPVTHRGTSTAVHVVNGRDGLDAAACTVLREGGATLVVLMGVAGLEALVARALAQGTDPGTPAAIIESGGCPTERVTRAPLGAITARAQEVGVRAPAVIVIGGVTAPGLLDGPCA